jgi:hypothetical protein
LFARLVKSLNHQFISSIEKYHCVSLSLTVAIAAYRCLVGLLLHQLCWLCCTPYLSLVSSTWSEGSAAFPRAPGHRSKRYNVAVFTRATC